MMYYIYLVFSLACGLLSILGDHINLGMLDYAVFVLFFLTTIVIKKARIIIPKSYFIIFALFIGTMCVNANISPYTLNLKYISIGAISTILPFILYILSYNYTLNDSQTNNLIDAWIKFILSLILIAIIETLLMSSHVIDYTALLKISIIKPGFFASMCNMGIILALYQYSLHSLKKYKNIAIIFSVAALLTVQLKVIISMVIIWTMYKLIIMTKLNKAKTILSLLGFIFIFALIVQNIPPISGKIDKYINLYGATNAYESVARPALYYQSVNIANDFFPFGSGQGTFGSIPVNMVYNDIYYDYGLNTIHGLGESGDNFKMDTHWSSILGENGYLGSFFYLLLFFYPLFSLKKAKRTVNYKSYKFLIQTIILVIFFESLTLCIPGRMAFMFIYAGILSIICHRIKIESYNIQQS